MLTLPFALIIVMIELTVGSFIALYLLDLRGDSSRGFILFQGVLYLIFGGLSVLAMNGLAGLSGLDTRWLGAQAPLLLAFTLLMIPWNVLLWIDRTSSPKARKPPPDSPPPDSPPPGATPMIRWARFALGGLTVLVGLTTLFVVGMAYRVLADSRLGGAFVVLAFLAGALALGGILTAMLLGHWYLNTPTASSKPLEFVTIVTIGALAVGFGCALLTGPSTGHAAPGASTVAPGTVIQSGPGGQLIITTPTPQTGQTGASGASPTTTTDRSAPLGTDTMIWLEYLVGFLGSLGLGGVALYLTRGRSFQAATGMLYICTTFVFVGEIIARGLLIHPLFYF